MLTHGNGADILAKALAVGGPFIRNGQIDRGAVYRHMVQNNTLPADVTRSIDATVEGVGRRALRAVSAVTNRPGLDRGIGSTSYEYDRITPVGEATQGMSILDMGARDLVTFARTAIPVPVTASTFKLDARHLAAGRGSGESVDMTNVTEHTRSVFEKLEDTLVNGSDVVLGGNSLPGYTNFGSRNTVSFSDTTWSSVSANTSIITDVLAMKQALEDDGFSGPFDLYIPSAYSSVMGEDYVSGYAKAVGARILEIDGVRSITVLPTLPAANVLLVQVDSSVVSMPIGQDFIVLPNQLMGGLATEWFLFIVATFALKARNCRAPLASSTLPVLSTGSGIAHLS